MSLELVVDPDALDEREMEMLAYTVQAEAIEVKDQATFEVAATLRRALKDYIAHEQSIYKPMKQAQDAAKKVILDQEKAALEGPMAVLEIVNRKLGAYEDQQRREKVIAEARAAQEAKAIEAARPVTPGVPQMPVVVPAAPVQMPKAEGLGFFSVYTLEEDVPAGGRMALIKAVAGGWGTAMVLEPNLPMLRDLVTTSKGKLKIPGYKVVETRRPRG